jgi:hypothetical protein
VTCRRSISVAGLRPCPVGSGRHGTRIQGDASSLQARNIRHEEKKQTAGLLDLISGWMTPEVMQVPPSARSRAWLWLLLPGLIALGLWYANRPP